MTVPHPVLQAYHRGRLLILWAEIPFPLAARPPVNRVQALNRWQAGAGSLAPLSASLLLLPPLPILSLDPTNRLERAFAGAGVPLNIVRTRRDVPTPARHSLLKLAGDLKTRRGVILSRPEIQNLHTDPDKRYLLNEARRIIGNDGALLLLDCQPESEDFRAWRAVLFPALETEEIFALGRASADLPPGVSPLECNFESLKSVLWKNHPPDFTIAGESEKGDPMPTQSDLQKLISRKQRRLQKLKEQEAIYGINTPPEVLIQIEDLEEELKQLQAQLAAAPANESSAPQKPDTPPSGGGTVYNIHIQQASGLAIGDGAQVEQNKS